MSERKASVLVCDDLLFALTGKATLIGVYNSDIIITDSQAAVPQLIFFFMIESSRDDPFEHLTLQVHLPDSAPAELQIPIGPMPPAISPDRKRIVIRHPFLISRPILKPGRIETSVIHEKGIIDAGGQWVSTLADIHAMQRQAH